MDHEKNVGYSQFTGYRIIKEIPSGGFAEGLQDLKVKLFWI